MGEALGTMNNSLVMRAQSGDGYYWTFKHPTIGDAFAAYLAQNPELVDIYILGSKTETLIREVTCGETNIRGSKEVLPRNRYSSLIGRLKELENPDTLFIFLTSRCETRFVEEYIESDDRLWDEIVTPIPYLSYSTKVRLLSKLHKDGILPEEHRIRFVHRVESLSVDMPDPAFLTDDNVRSLLEDHEIERILARVRAEVIPQLEAIISNERDNFDPQTAVREDHFAELKRALEAYLVATPIDDSAIESIDQGLAQIEGDIDWLNSEYDFDARDRMNDLNRDRNIEPDLSDRNIFDDVEECEGD